MMFLLGNVSQDSIEKMYKIAILQLKSNQQNNKHHLVLDSIFTKKRNFGTRLTKDGSLLFKPE
jgi:hypothetical protein